MSASAASSGLRSPAVFQPVRVDHVPIAAKQVEVVASDSSASSASSASASASSSLSTTIRATLDTLWAQIQQFLTSQRGMATMSAAAAVGLLLLTYYSYRRQLTASGTSKTSRRASSSSASSSSSKDAANALVSPENLLPRLDESLEQLGAGGLPKADISDAIIADILRVDPTLLTAEAVFKIAKWLVAYHSSNSLALANTLSESKTDTKKAREIQASVRATESNNFSHVWLMWQKYRLKVESDQLLAQDRDEESARLRLELPLLGIELAQRLRNPVVINEAYDILNKQMPNYGDARSVHNPESLLRSEAVLALFMTAPTLGRWDDVLQLGTQLKADRGDDALEQFRQASLQEFSFPDYLTFFERCKVFAQERRKDEQADLLFEQYDVTSVTMTHVSSKSDIKPIHDVLQRSMTPEDKQPTTTTHQPGERPFLRNGACVQLLAPGPMPLPLHGQVLSKSFHVFACVPLSPDEAPGPTTGTPKELEVEMSMREEARINGGQEREFIGSFWLRHYLVDKDGKRMQLEFGHQFNVEMTMKLVAA